MTRLMILSLGAALALGATAYAGDDGNAPAAAIAGQNTAGPHFVDNDGDGICDYYQARGGQGVGQRARGKGKRLGPGDGTGNQGVGPRDGTGYGAKAGSCDGTGPHGKRARRGGAN